MRIHHYAMLAASLSFCSCSSIHTVPHLINGCEITATSYQAALDAKHALDPQFHSRILVIIYVMENGEKTGHAVCVWRYKGIYYAYDYEGTRTVYTGLIGQPINPTPNLPNNIKGIHTADGDPDPMVFARQLKKHVVNAFYEGVNGPDKNFEN